MANKLLSWNDVTKRWEYISSAIVGGMDQHANEYHDPDMALETHDHGGIYAPVANGVTNGDSHDHDGGDGGQIDHTKLSNKGTNTHTEIDTHVGAAAPHSGHETPTGAQAKVDAHKGVDVSAVIHPNAFAHMEASAPHSGHAALVHTHPEYAYVYPRLILMGA